MAFHNEVHRVQNSRVTGFGVGAYDYMKNEYVSDGGSGFNLSATSYYRGGQQEAGTLVARIEYTYDANNNLTIAERVS
jgi:hypothetical protein